MASPRLNRAAGRFALCRTWVWCILSLLPIASLPADLLPAHLVPDSHERDFRQWTIPALVQVRRITGLAVSIEGRELAFVIKEADVGRGETRYALYTSLLEQAAVPRKLLETTFLDDLAADPRGNGWTLRADLGQGVQLYRIDNGGKATPLIIAPQMARVGGWEGEIAGLGAPHEAGVLSYEWAPDGSALWYTRPRLRSDADRTRLTQGGIVYNDMTMSAIAFRNDASSLLGTELRLFRSKSSTDELVAFAPSVPTMDLGIFRRDWGTAAWAPDSRRLLYSLPIVTDDGKRQTTLWQHDVQNGRVRELRVGMPVVSIVPANDGQHYLTVERHTDGYRLLQHTLAGSVAKDLGAVPYDRIGAGFGLGMWVDRAHGRTILGVHYSSHDGLATVPESAAGRALSRIVDNLSLCSFARDLAVGACVRESLTMPPEVVAISMKDGTVTTLTKPNAHYDAITPLRVERAHWTNRYNNRSDGYITYPRNYQPERKYPAVVVTHAADARNRFADQEFQWDFPVEVLAESGYFVLSVNEPYASLRARATVQERSRKEQLNVSDAQFRFALDAVATMEAALSSLVASGAVDPRRGGIAGYSRGAEVVLYVMTQSKMFTAAAIGDGEANASSYWASGIRLSATWYRMLYGGSPYDEGPGTIANYRKLSPSFRTREFAGPLLQLFAGATASAGLELHRLLQEVGVPAELVFFPNEAHLFWHPRHRAAAMQRSLDWFNSWLLGEGNHPVSASESRH